MCLEKSCVLVAARMKKSQYSWQLLGPQPALIRISLLRGKIRELFVKADFLFENSRWVEVERLILSLVQVHPIRFIRSHIPELSEALRRPTLRC